ncbi:TLD containing protein [Pandoravirus salinus]|uniref:TLD containing protein n=1 Tax=Pandoravirus salinus TaxID=1349410 RepID=S4VZ49_9VIRU|nr:TLD-containing protein [Pandoravirus salinus]AGO84776.2 TLD containing protein [Pandoravirus salinus]
MKTSADGMANPFDLLPDELVLAVLRCVARARTVVAFGATCRRMRAIAADSALWPPFASTCALVNDDQRRHLDAWYGPSWHLLYRASRDGWHASDFHRACDGQGPTVTIIRTTKGHLFGGHLSKSWHSRRQWICDSSASLFTLSNAHGTPPTRFPIADASCAACGDDRYGPVYGGKTRGNDLHIASRANEHTFNLSHSYFPNAYTDPEHRGYVNLLAGDFRIVADEIQVFTR